MSLDDALSFTFRGVTIDRRGVASMWIDKVDGWFSAPDGSAESAPMSGGHGESLGPVLRKARSVLLVGNCVSRTVRDELFWQLREAMADTAPDTLSGTVAGKTLTATASLLRYDISVVRGLWRGGAFGFQIEWKCGDPLLYDMWRSGSALLPQPGVGVAPPLAPPVLLPANPVGGMFTVANDGNAHAPAVYTITGPVEMPGVLLNGGTARQKVVTYGITLGASDRLVIDTARGGGFLNGAQRSPILGSARAKELELVPKSATHSGVNSVAALGTAGAGAASVAVAFRPAYF